MILNRFTSWLKSLFKKQSSQTPVEPPAPPIVPINQNSIGTLPWYKQNWEMSKINNSDLSKNELSWAISKIIQNIHRYQIVEQKAKVPWQLIAGIHYREASLNFNTCLHNGDPLGEKTVHVPKGRGPFNTWEEAAIDALAYDNIGPKDSWSISSMLQCAEIFNGLGYLKYHQDTLSPYLWSGTNLYLGKGRYVEDGKFRPESIEDQIGIAAIFHKLEENNLLPYAK